ALRGRHVAPAISRLNRRQPDTETRNQEAMTEVVFSAKYPSKFKLRTSAPPRWPLDASPPPATSPVHPPRQLRSRSRSLPPARRVPVSARAYSCPSGSVQASRTLQLSQATCTRCSPTQDQDRSIHWRHP